jgi:hypothetical protein
VPITNIKISVYQYIPATKGARTIRSTAFGDNQIESNESHKKPLIYHHPTITRLGGGNITTNTTAETDSIE